MAEKIKVRITGSQTVRYDQVKEMTRQEWQHLKSLDDEVIDVELGEWLDLNDVFDFDDMEDTDAVVVDDDGEVLNPIDRIN